MSRCRRSANEIANQKYNDNLSAGSDMMAEVPQYGDIHQRDVLAYNRFADLLGFRSRTAS